LPFCKPSSFYGVGLRRSDSLHLPR
jgi:hypothetical protein